MKALRQFGFNAGEWDPRLAIRSDLDKYHYACTELVNFDVDSGGSVSRRRGLELVGEFAPEGSYRVLEACAESMLFDGAGKYLVVFFAIGQELSDGNREYTETRCVVHDISTGKRCGSFILDDGSAVASDLRSLRVRQSQDVLFVVHPAMPPKEILRDLDENGEYTFSAREFEFECPAMLSASESESEISFAPLEDSDEFEIGCYTEGYLSNIPDGLSVGDTLALECETTQTLYVDWGSETDLKTSEAIPATGTVKLETGGGRWAGELAIEVSYDFGETWAVLTSVVAPDDGSLNPSTSATIEDFGVWVRVRLLRRQKATYVESVQDQTPVELDYGCKWWLKTDGVQIYYYRVEELLADGRAKVTCLNGSPKAVSSKTYYLNAWNKTRGYPMCVEIAQERLWFLGNNEQPKTVWGSQTNNLKNFCSGTLATSAVSFVPSASVYDRSYWFKWGKNVFLIGGSMSEMSMSSGAANATISATSIGMSNQTTWGSANVDAVSAGDKLFYAKSGGELLNAQLYNFGTDSYASTQVNNYAKHLFADGNDIVKLAYARNPHSCVFALGAKGSVGKFVFSADENVSAWARYEFAPGLRCLTLTSIQDRATDVLVCVLVDDNDGKKCKIGKINFKSDVWTDFGYEYESRLCAMPMDIFNGHTHGARVSIAGVDIYGNGIGDFEVSFDGGITYAVQYSGFDVAGNNLYRSGKVECEWNSDYEDVAQLAIRTQSHSAFTLIGYGADIKISR